MIARGVARLQGQRGGHSARLFKDDADLARAELEWPHAPFQIPDDVLGMWRQAGKRSELEYQAWQKRLNALSQAERREFDRVLAGELPEGWQEVLRTYERDSLVGESAPGGILISAEINDRLAEILPERMVGCADLEAPTSHKRRLKAFTAQDHGGAYIHCGVREHVMGSMVNGMAAHGGIIPLAVTYLAFSDYERPAMRMAALMRLPAKFVFSHDSIGVGKNGPTHQPVEILASLRAMPNMLVMRPADAIEASECWEIALEHRTGPVSMVFARQALPRVRTELSADNRSKRGGYILAEASGVKRAVTLMATGSEVAIAMAARERLQAEGIATAVVSMPCCELFDQQDQAYRSKVLGSEVVRVAIEAAVRFGWDRYLGERGDFVGMKGFGASGGAEQLYEYFNITAAEVVSRVKRLMN
jgi:transketolase